VRTIDDSASFDQAVEEIFRQLHDLALANPLQAASVTKGRVRFIGGTLRVDSGGRVEIVGTLEIDGSKTVTGAFHLAATSDWSIDGDGNIAGDVTITGNFNVSGGGKITAGNVTIEPNKITVAGGSSPATLQDGKLSFGTGGAVEADTSVGGARMVAGDAVVNVGSTASVRKGNASVVAGPLGVDINAAALRLLINAPVTLSAGLIPTVSGTGLPPNVLMITSGGAMRRTA